jgi:citrate synthase
MFIGMVENDFYTAVFAVSRALGCLSNGVWSRAFGLPIERPNSINIDAISRLSQTK